MSDYIIRTMTQQELADYPLTWAEAEGWRPGVHDVDYFYPTDPSGFFLGVLDDEPIAAISGVKYGNNFGFVGLYLVKSEYRGQGYGFKIWQHAIHSLAGRNMGLDGVIAQQANYQKSGFKIAHRNLRFETLGLGEKALDTDIIELNATHSFQVQQYDIPFYPADRQDFIQRWLNQKQGRALGLIKNQVLTAYGVIRACHGGYRIGGWYADNKEQAEVLLLALLHSVPLNSLVWIDMPEPNTDALALAEQYQMTMVFEVARMYTGNFPTINLAKTFGNTTLELG